MNKTELVTTVAKEANLSKADTQAVVDATLAAISDTLASGDSVAFPGFGTFSVLERGARKGRNPVTGEAIDIPASKGAKFKAGKQLKDAVNA